MDVYYSYFLKSLFLPLKYAFLSITELPIFNINLMYVFGFEAVVLLFVFYLSHHLFFSLFSLIFCQLSLFFPLYSHHPLVLKTKWP